MWGRRPWPDSRPGKLGEINLRVIRPPSCGRRPGAGAARRRGRFSRRETIMFRFIKYGVLSVVVGTLVVGFLFGGDAMSYVRTSGRSVRESVHDKIPLEFQLRRARDLLGDILPEMQANVRVMAQQEVEIEAAKDDIELSQKSLAEEGGRIRILREAVASGRTSLTLA